MTDIARLRTGGIGGQFWSVYVDPELQGQAAVTATLEQIDIVHQMMRRYPDTFELAVNADDVERIFKGGKIASLVGMEGGHSIDNSLGTLRMFYRLGARYMGMVGAFNDKIEFHPSSFTDNRDQLARALKDLDFGYPTRLYDAVDQSIDQLNGKEGRKVVLVFTDGDDNSSKKSSGSVMERARAEEVMIYSIGLENEYFNGQQRVRSSPDRALHRLSEETGGGFFLLKKKDDLGPTFTRIAQELHSQYVLGFSPETLDGKIHKLEVRVKRAGAIPRARKSYVATRADSTQK